MSRLGLSSLAAITLLLSPLAAAAQPPPLPFVPMVIVLNGVAMEDVRAVGPVEWRPGTKEIEIQGRYNPLVVLKEGRREALLVWTRPARPFLLEAPPTRWQGTLYVPVSLDRELDMTVTWDPASGVVTWTGEDEHGKPYTVRHVRMDLPLLAAQKHDLAELRRLLQANPEMLKERRNGHTPLHWAAANDDLPVMATLLTSGADVTALAGNRKWDESPEGRQRGETPLHLAARYGRVAAARLLLKHGATVSVHDDKDFSTPLHLAVQAGSVELVRLLLAHQADVAARGALGNTPLHLAAQSGNTTIAALLLAAGAKATARNTDVRGSADSPSNEPIHLAAGAGSVAMVSLLLQHGAKVNAVGQYYYTPLHRAAAIGSVPLVQFLLMRGADIGATDMGSRTPLHWAARNGHVAVAQLLLNRGAPLESVNRTPLWYAAEQGQVGTAKLLLDHGAKVNARGDSGKTPLDVAAEGGHAAVARLLIARGASLNAEDRDSQMPLHRAATGGHVDVARVLLDAGANLQATGQEHFTALHMAAAKGRLEMVRFLIARGANVNAAAPQSRETPLHAVAGRYYWATETTERARGQSYVQIARLLLDHGADVNARARENETPLHKAAANGCFAIAQALVDGGADVNARGQGNATPLHEAALRGHLTIVRLLVAHGADLAARDGAGRTVLHAAVVRDPKLAVVRLLLDRGVDVHARDNQGHEAIQLVGHDSHWRTGLRETIELLRERGALPSLHQAAALHDATALRQMIAAGADVNARDETGRTPLHRVLDRDAMGRRINDVVEPVQVLLAAGADPNAKTRDGRVPLAMVGPSEIDAIVPLLEAGADATVRSHWNFDWPLLMAAERGRLDVVKALVERGADVNAADGGGTTALDIAVQERKQDVVDYLRSKGAKHKTPPAPTPPNP